MRTSNEVRNEMVRFKTGSDFKVVDSSLNAKYRKKLQTKTWKQYLASKEGQMLQVLKSELEDILYREDLAIASVRFQQITAWRGNRAIARNIQGRLEKAGVSFERIDALSGSIYFETDGPKLRIADHDDVGRTSAEFLASTHEVTPFSSDWKTVTEDFINSI